MKLLVSLSVVVLLAVQLTFADDVDLDRLRQFLKQRALNSQRYVGEPPAKSKPAPLVGEPAGQYVYQYDDQVNNVNDQGVRGVPEDEYMQAQRQLSPEDLQLQEYQEPQNAAEEGPLIQEERYMEPQNVAEEGPLIQEERYMDPQEGPVEQQQAFNVAEPNVPYNEERAFEEPQGVDMNVFQGADELEQQERRMMEEESQRMEMEEQIMAQQRELEAVQSDEERLESLEIRGINEELEVDAAEALEQRATKEGDGKKEEKPTEKPVEKPTEKPTNGRNKWQRFQKQKVVVAEKFERAGPNDDFKKFAVVVTVENGRQYFIRKLASRRGGWGGRRGDSRIQVVDAALLTSNWKKTATKDINSSTVGDYMKAANVGRNSYEGLALMWKLT